MSNTKDCRSGGFTSRWVCGRLVRLVPTLTMMDSKAHEVDLFSKLINNKYRLSSSFSSTFGKQKRYIYTHTCLHLVDLWDPLHLETSLKL